MLFQEFTLKAIYFTLNDYTVICVLLRVIEEPAHTCTCIMYVPAKAVYRDCDVCLEASLVLLRL